MQKDELILIVDDDKDMRDTICAVLEIEGFTVIEAEDADSMNSMVEAHDISLILLDLMLPGSDGLSIMRKFRPKSDIPVVMLTGKDDIIDKIVGLEIGADDYITKPFHTRELVARIKSVLRRKPTFTEPAQDEPSRTPQVNHISFSGWKMDLYAHRLSNPDGQDIKLTSYEFTVLSTLIESAGRVLTRDQLLDRIYNGSVERSPFDRSLDVLIAKVRKKLGDNPKSPKYIRTIRQSGYIFIDKIT